MARERYNDPNSQGQGQGQFPFTGLYGDYYGQMMQSPQFNYYGSQMISSQPLQTQFPTGEIESRQHENGAETDSGKSAAGKGKGPGKGKGKKQASSKTYETLNQDEEKFLVNLWVSNHERLESKDSSIVCGAFSAIGKLR
jgi:hypothetical protein